MIASWRRKPQSSRWMKIGVHGLGRRLECRVPPLCPLGLLLQPGQRKPRLLAGSAEGGRLLRQDFVAEKVET
jgi:hypothetical protein